MIPVQDIIKRVQDLSRKDKSGYMSSEELTRDLNETQQMLMDYYWDRFSNSQDGIDSLNPFIKEVELQIKNGFVDFPDDYRHRIEMGNVFIENQYGDNCSVSNPKVTEAELRYLHPSEERLTVTSHIRKPSVEKKRIYHSFVNNRIKILPKETVGYVVLKYLAQPPVAIYATTINPTTDKEEYDASNSVDLEWNAQDLHNIVDIMLLFKAIEVRESALVNWVMARKRIVDENPVK